MAEETDSSLIRDPKRLRALAHPLRWDLIDLLTAEGSATATRCAQVLGHSVASCSYHLNTLAKYGFVEPAPGGEGREKPWTLTSLEQNFRLEGLDQEGRLAGEQAAEAFLDHETVLMKDRLRRVGLEPEAWRRVSGFSGGTTFLTAEELSEVRKEFVAIFHRYSDRLADLALRPKGAREVRLFNATTVAPERPAGVSPASSQPRPANGQPGQ
jgi:hypothetical protein